MCVCIYPPGGEVGGAGLGWARGASEGGREGARAPGRPEQSRGDGANASGAHTWQYLHTLTHRVD